MPETFDDIVREYIDFVNQQVGVYMDAIAGFAGHYTRIKRQIHRINKPQKRGIDENGNNVIVYTCYEDPTKPDVIHNRIIRASDYLTANFKNGSNAQQLSQAAIVFLFTYWELEVRPRLAKARGVAVREVHSDIMGDLRIMRNAILHSKGVLDSNDYKKLLKLNNMFVAGHPVQISYENLHQIFILIKQDCARMLFEWLNVNDAPILPEEVVDIAIQRNAMPEE